MQPLHPYVRGCSREESEVPSQVIADSVQQELGCEIIILALISRLWPRGQEGVSREYA